LIFYPELIQETQEIMNSINFKELLKYYGFNDEVIIIEVTK